MKNLPRPLKDETNIHDNLGSCFHEFRQIHKNLPSKEIRVSSFNPVKSILQGH